jgi:hypothetical protein
MSTVQCPLCPAEIQAKGLNRHYNSLHHDVTCKAINTVEGRAPPGFVDCEYCQNHYLRAGLTKHSNKCPSHLSALAENGNENGNEHENENGGEHEN